jgi:hypothetical protein
MRVREIAPQVDPLDVLRRFVATPLKATYRMGITDLTVQTNDHALLPTFAMEAVSQGSKNNIFQWKLVRDGDAHGSLETPMFLETGALTVVHMGPACLLALDAERKVLLGFIGADVDAGSYQEYLLPIFRKLTNDALAAPELPFYQNARVGT